MAKTYIQTFAASAETAYATGITPLMGLATLNKSVRFTPLQKSKYTTDNGKYTIQRLKRIKATDLPAATGKAGDDHIARLNASKKIDWTSIETQTAAEKNIAINIEPNEEFDLTNVPADFNRPMTDMITNTLVEGEELAVAKVIAGAATKADIDLTDADGTVLKIEEEIQRIELLVDDFKAYSDNVIVLIHPSVAKIFSKLQGQGYQTGTNTFPNGLGKSFRYDNIEFYESKILNAIPSSTDKVAGAIVMDREAYANIGITAGITPYDETNTGTRTVGHRYYGLDLVVDPSRISVLEMAQANPTKKVNA